MIHDLVASGLRAHEGETLRHGLVQTGSLALVRR
jgi:hypothetical protein